MASTRQTNSSPDSRGVFASTLHALGRLFFTAVRVAAATCIILALVGGAQRIGLLPTGEGPAVTSSDASASEYTCPMHPQIRQPSPGRCPICGMALVPASSEQATAADSSAVTISPAARRLAGIETSTVTREPIADVISVVGKLAMDESRVATIASYVDGRIERLFADYTGVYVDQGDHLAVVFSPELYAAQVDYLESRRALERMRGDVAGLQGSQRRLVESSRSKLVELGMTNEQITEVETGDAQSRITIYSPIQGTVIEKPVRVGQYVKAGEPIYRVADLRTVWLLLELFPDDAARVRYGQDVTAKFQSIDDKTFHGRVAFIAPTVDEKTRTVAVRVEFDNPDGALRPGDYARAEISTPLGAVGEVYDPALAGKWISPMHPQVVRDEPGQCPICGMDLVPTSTLGFAAEPQPEPTSIVVLRSAVLRAAGESVVYVETEPGRFEIRRVELGPVLQDRVVIASGVAAGETVATDGVFLIDSQMQLASKPSLIDPTKAAPPTPSYDLQAVPKLLAGEPGEQIETLLAAYVQMQRALAADEAPSEDSVAAYQHAAEALGNASELPAAAREALTKAGEAVAHLHHLNLKQAREKFAAVSRAAILAAQAGRGAEASQALLQAHCPMVAGGGADWLQTPGELRNPYMGSAMLTCGESVRELGIPAAHKQQVEHSPVNPATDAHEHAH